MGRISGLPNHLGGHGFVTHTDVGLIKFARDELNCKSMLDIGCGVGGQVYEAINLGLDARGIDGDFVTKREKPELFELHDFTKGKLESIKMNFDMVWCCEFVEHVAKEYEDNWMSLMQKGKYVFVTYSEPGKPGHHHVNCEPLDYWLKLYDKYGFDYEDELTKKSKELSTMKREFWNDCGLIFKRR
jgi:SAM-dependent methyltransferase